MTARTGTSFADLKLQAEAEKLRMEAALAKAADNRAAEAHRLEQVKLEAETRKLQAEAEAAEWTAEVHAVQVRQVRESERERMTSNAHYRTYAFTAMVDEDSVLRCIRNLQTWMRLDGDDELTRNRPYEIVFSSPGGSVIDGMALYDYIQQVRRSGHKVITGTLGYAASMAGVLLQAGDERWMGAESYLLLHELSGVHYGKLGDLEDSMDFSKKMMGRIYGIFAARSTLTEKQVATKMARKDWWLDSSEALKLQLVDEVR